MRIIAGTNKGRTLKAPKWDGLRPTSDKLRETLFNILQPRIEGARVLDVFAGTGAVALEALSRGAVVGDVRRQRSARGGADRRERRALPRVGTLCYHPRRRGARADDSRFPAVRSTSWCWIRHTITRHLDEAVRDAAAQRAAGGIVILEHASRVTPPQPAGLTLTRTVKSGDSALTFYS